MLMALMEIALQFSAWAQSIASDWGYLGIFVVGVLGSASIIFPAPAFAVIFAFGAILNPWLVGIVAGAGSAIGELTGYLIGRGGREVIEKKHEKWLKKTQKWIDKYGFFAVLVVFAATPLPDDIVGILAGVFEYDWKRFLLASFIGKVIMSLALAFGGYYGVGWAMSMFGGL
jgi:membrane protein YqaA with SNARE-associated domain